MLLQDLKECLSYPYDFCFGSQSFLYNFWPLYGRNVKRLGVPMTLFSCSIWFLPQPITLHALCIAYTLSFSVLLVAVGLAGGKDADTPVKNVHPSGILGMPFAGKLASWAKHFCLWVTSTNLAAYFWVWAHSANSNLWVSVYPVQPLLVSGAAFLAVYLLKLMQKTNDYYYLKSAWRMHNAELTYDVFNKDFREYRSYMHVVRGLVEWVWVTAQTVFMATSVTGFVDPALVGMPVYWLYALCVGGAIGLKVAFTSRKFSFGYIEDKLCLSYCCYKEEASGNFFPRLKSPSCLIDEGPVVEELKAPRSNIFYDGLLHLFSKPCPQISPFCIIDSDDSDGLSEDEGEDQEGRFLGENNLDSRSLRI